MGIKDPRGDGTLHVAYATGALKFLRFVSEGKKKGRTTFSVGEIFKVARSGDGDADFFIFEFIKDCGCTFDVDQCEAIANGEHRLLWMYVNADLKRFGHPEIEPVPLAP